VTVEYYSDDHGNWQSDANYPNGPGRTDTGITPTFNFVKKETWGYSLNGKEFHISQGAAYTVVQDSFEGTKAMILDGTNNSTVRDACLNTKGGTGRQLTKSVNTGWIDIDDWCGKYPENKWQNDIDFASNIFKLWGMADLSATKTDTYTISLSYDHLRLNPEQIERGYIKLLSRDEKGNWINTIDMNTGGTKKFVLGPYKSGYGLGTYGVDLKTHTVWAVVNHAGDFVVVGFKKHSPRQRWYSHK